MNIREHITTGALSRIRGTEGPRSVVPPPPKVEDLAGVAGATGHFEGRMLAQAKHLLISAGFEAGFGNRFYHHTCTFNVWLKGGTRGAPWRQPLARGTSRIYNDVRSVTGDGTRST